MGQVVQNILCNYVMILLKIWKNIFQRWQQLINCRITKNRSLDDFFFFNFMKVVFVLLESA